MVIDNPEDERISPRDVLLHHHLGAVERITDQFSGYLPLQFPVFFPFGEQGWIEGWQQQSTGGKLELLSSKSIN
jgi:hypothetical protein